MCFPTGDEEDDDGYSEEVLCCAVVSVVGGKEGSDDGDGATEGEEESFFFFSFSLGREGRKGTSNSFFPVGKRKGVGPSLSLCGIGGEFFFLYGETWVEGRRQLSGLT